MEVSDTSTDGLTLTIQRSVWNGQVQTPKTVNAFREVDLYPSVSALLKSYVGERTSGLLFSTAAGKPISQTNILKRSLHPVLKAIGRDKAGFHSFRRFRTTWLRKKRAPEDLIRFWLGHSNKTVTDGYSKLKEDVAFRKDEVGKAGLGFEVPSENFAEKPNVARTARNFTSEETLSVAA